MLDKFREECGLIGVVNAPEAANLSYLGLYAQQHRGQEGAGVVSHDLVENESHFFVHKGLGLVTDVFQDFDFAKLPGKLSIGHVRYTTAGGNRLANVQPFYAETTLGCLALAHNGNLINTEELREELMKDGAIFASTSDTEIFIHLLARAPRHSVLAESVIDALKKVKGAYSLIIMFADRLLAIRDPNGFRPLALATAPDGSLFVASETCAFDLIGAQYLRDVEAGEVVEIFMDGKINSYFPFGQRKESPCIFEHVYFARPDSNVFGENVYRVRKNMGIELAREFKTEADLVVPVPDSGVTAAIGFSQETGIPLELGLIRNHYVGRTFIEPKQAIRDFGVKIKLNPNADIIRDKRVIVVDDSIVRGTTSRKLVQMLRQAGAKEVHMRISSPPTTDPCYYGIDTPEKSELIAAKKSNEEIAAYLGVDSLVYLSIDGLYRAVNSSRGKFCDACFTGNYPIGIINGSDKQQQKLFDV